jgi:hypothetical protein
MKAFYVMMLITNMHGHVVRHEHVAGWMTEHQCHLEARRIEMNRPHTIASCQVEGHH